MNVFLSPKDGQWHNPADQNLVWVSVAPRFCTGVGSRVVDYNGVLFTSGLLEKRGKKKVRGWGKDGERTLTADIRRNRRSHVLSRWNIRPLADSDFPPAETHRHFKMTKMWSMKACQPVDVHLVLIQPYDDSAWWWGEHVNRGLVHEICPLDWTHTSTTVLRWTLGRNANARAELGIRIRINVSGRIRLRT